MLQFNSDEFSPELYQIVFSDGDSNRAINVACMDRRSALDAASLIGGHLTEEIEEDFENIDFLLPHGLADLVAHTAPETGSSFAP